MRYHKPTQMELVRLYEAEMFRLFDRARREHLASHDITAHYRAIVDSPGFQRLTTGRRECVAAYWRGLRDVLWRDYLVVRYTLHGEDVPKPCKENDWLHLLDNDRVTLSVWKADPSKVYLDHGSPNHPTIR